MWFHRCFGPIYRWIFNHSSGPVTMYMDYFRTNLIGPEDPKFKKANADILLSAYRAHNAAIQALVPKEKLLVYRMGEGWEPLCKFLGKPIPNQPFPHENRLGSVIEELANDKHYQATMRRQHIGWLARVAMISAAVYLYKNPAALPAIMQKDQWA